MPIVGRGDLPFALLHGTSLVDHATLVLRRAGVEVIASGESWSSVRATVGERTAALALHDPLCPLTPESLVTQAIATAVASGNPVVGVRPVTDTIKTLSGERVRETVDRESLVAVASPIVLPVAVVAELDGWPDLSDFAALVTWLRSRFEVELVEAPSLGRRVEDESAVLLLEAYEELHPW